MFVVSGCQNAAGVVSYYLNAIDITTGGDLMSGGGTAGGIQIVGPSGVFRPGNQFQRPALLLSHTKNAMGQTTGTYLYIGFGTGITELGSGTKGYNGWIFGYSISYTGTTPTSVGATALTNSPFSTTPSEATSGVYPPTSAAAPGWAGSPAANPSCNTSSNCFNGDNWVDGTNVTGHAGGVWMSGRGPSSDASADVYFGAGNGTFGCTTSGTTCTSVSTVNNFGESAVEFAAPLASSPSISVADFYAPYTNNVANDQPANGSPFSAASTQVQALNRYDLDFGDPGVISFVTQVSSGTQTWLTTADKTGYVYVMPTLSSGSGSNGMGQFRTGDSGLTSGSYTTQAPFQMSRLPASTGSSTVCPAPVGSTSPEFSSANCDQIMGFAAWSNSSTLSTYLLYAWPWNEPVIGREGSASAGPPVNFAFNTTIEPCPGWPGTACPSGFPIGNQAYGGGKLAIAANGASNATLWGSKYSTAMGDTGQLWAWVINPTSGSLTPLFSPTISSNNAANCTGYLPTLPSSYVPASFAEPTLVNGKVYVPAFEAFSSGTTILTGGGVLVFGTCQ